MSYSSSPWGGNAGTLGGVGKAANLSNSLLLSCATTLGLGMLSGLTTKTSIKDWYPSLKKPDYTPPNAAFPIAWTLLYLAQGVAVHRVWERVGKPAISLNNLSSLPTALKLFGLQFALNLAWSPLFFGAKKLGAAMLDIGAMWVATAFTIREFFTVDAAAGKLMVPYLAWISYASYLNWGVMSLNPEFK